MFGARDSYESLQYEVLSKADDFEIRKYPKRLVAETTGIADRDKAFMKLFNYIQGENLSEEIVSMTIPVQLHEQRQKQETIIPMTTPVEVKEEEGVTMRFFLPRSFTAETAPRAKDSDIRIRELKSEYFATLEYTGSTDQEKFEEKKAQLMEYINKSGWKLTGPVTQYVYDGPFTLPFLRRNEAIAPVLKISE